VEGDLFTFSHPLWLWLAAGGLLLIAEIATGSSWLLWPAVCAAFVGALTAAGLPFPLQDQLALWAVLSVVTTFASRRLFRRARAAEPEAEGDINEVRLLGRTGQALSDFSQGRGRILVDGCEWAAESEPGEEVRSGARVEVVARVDGARLKVRAAV
jgi:inner membrane protein